MTKDTLATDTGTGSAWDFGSVFAALKTPPTSPFPAAVKQEQAEPEPYFHRNYSQNDDETPKATPATELSTALFDFDKALSFLGYFVSISEPTSSLDVPPVSVDDQTATDDTPTKPKKSNAIKSNISGLEATKRSARQAEDGRRAVLDGYLGSSPEDTFGKTKPKTTKEKPIPTWTSNGLTPSSVPPSKVASCRKQVSMNAMAEKKAQLMSELKKQFQEESISLAQISTPIIEPDPCGVHVFVDISNILIGFHDTLKRNRNINKNIRIKRQTLSFHSLSLILERGRPTAKRFLAGSDDIDCTQEARLLGYTTHILQRVDKPDYSFLPGTRKGMKSGLTSSDTDSGTPTRVRRAEQAVDEVLHLGMLQSLIDTDAPSTMVLASGDAAKAEFSDGFLKQAERALLKGWKVEVIAFKATTGSAYRDPEWRSRWGSSFRLILLDDFAELLHVPWEGSNF